MGLKKLSAKVADYYERLDKGKASKIKPGHVGKVLEKLRKKEADITAELEAVASEDKRKRLEGKLRIAREHIERAEFLITEIAKPSGDPASGK